MASQKFPRRSFWARSLTGLSAALAALLGSTTLAPQADARSLFEPAADGVVYVRKTIVVGRNTVFDGKGLVYSWDPNDPNNECSQKEGMDELFKLKTGATLRNVVIRYSPNGLEVGGDNVLIDNVTFEKVCEDALVLGYRGSKKRVHNVIIRNSEFRGGSDKQIQVNNAENVYMYGNKHVGGGAGMKISPGNKNIYLWSTSFDGTKHGVRLQSDLHMGVGDIAADGSFTRLKVYEYPDQPAKIIDISAPPALPFDPDARK
ncbi:MAG: pectate lyase [Neomegalonema sp.]|nr:pectate lyase [Neomegalonema sp.]